VASTRFVRVLLVSVVVAGLVAPAKLTYPSAFRTSTAAELDSAWMPAPPLTPIPTSPYALALPPVEFLFHGDVFAVGKPGLVSGMGGGGKSTLLLVAALAYAVLVEEQPCHLLDRQAGPSWRDLGN
jgi:hypothetical protein